MYFPKGSGKTETREAMRGGPGQVVINHLAENDGLPAKSRMFAELVLEKNCGIGSHVHEGETELFYFISGEGIAEDNGSEVIVKAGDCLSTGNGASHSIRNEKDETLRVLACIVLD